MGPNAGGEPTGDLLAAIQRTFDSFDTFKEKFTQTAINQFGSGWAWLTKTTDGMLEITATSNAGTPMTDGKIALLTCDVWEHAYYIDTRNSRPNYLENFWKVVNWDFVAENFSA
ncbi:MAG: sodB [Gammaproteobacteria bacterium]|nr:sodB [Gammaproteobacteria bacterium]